VAAGDEEGAVLAVLAVRGERLGKACDLGVRIAVLGAIVLLPLLYWPGLGGPFTVPKVSLLWILSAWGVACWLLRTLVRGEGRSLLRLPALFPFLAVIATFLVSGAYSINPHISLFGSYYRLEGLPTFLAYLSFYPLVATIFHRRHSIRLLLEVFLATAGVLALVAVLQVLGVAVGPPLGFDQRVLATFGNANIAGQFFAMAAVAALGLLALYRIRWKKGLALFVFLLCLFALLETYTRGAWIALAVGVVAALLFTSRRLRNENKPWALSVGILSFLVLVMVLALPGAGEYSLGSRFFSLVDSSTLGERTEYWKTGLRVLQNYPLLGSGPETLRLSSVPLRSEGLRDFDRAHNEFIDVGATRGFLGLAALLWFLVEILRRWWQYRQRAQDSYTKGLLAVLLGIWLTYLVADFFNFGTVGVTPLFWIVSGGIAAFAAVLPLRKTHGEEAEEVALSVAPAAIVLVGRWAPGRLVAVLVLGVLLVVGAGVATWQAVSLWQADAAYGRSIRSRELGETNVAVEAAQQAVSLFPQEGQYWLGLGIAQLEQGLQVSDAGTQAAELQAARRSLEKALPWVDQPVAVWMNLGSSYWNEAALSGELVAGRLTASQRSLLEEAGNQYRRAAEFDASVEEAWLSLSQVDLLRGEAQAALDAAAQVLILDSSSVAGNLAAARAELVFGHKGIAKSYIDEALRLDPGNSEAKELLQQTS